MPGRLDSSSLISILFPAWYFFLLGLVIGTAHEVLATRWSRLWVLATAIATLTYLCVALFGGNTVGLFLALPMAAATALASKAAATLLGRLLLFISVGSMLQTAPCLSYWNGAREEASPNNAYLLRKEQGFEGLSDGEQPFHVGPRYAPPTWFSSKVAQSYTMHWKNDHVLYTTSSVRKDIYSNYLNVRVITLFE